MVNFDLTGKTALVTGAAYGIGFAIAEALANAGARIAFNCRSTKNLDSAMDAYAAKGIDAHGYIADVSDEEQVKSLVEQIETELGGVDILVNNAGTAVMNKGRVVYSDNTKTDSSNRVLPLTAYMREYLKKVKLQQEENRELFGDAYIDNDLVCVHPNGSPIRPNKAG